LCKHLFPILEKNRGKSSKEFMDATYRLSARDSASETPAEFEIAVSLDHPLSKLEALKS
jgi:hypothetical protein